MPKLRPNSQLYRACPKEWLAVTRYTLNVSDPNNLSMTLSSTTGIRPSVSSHLSVSALPGPPPLFASCNPCRSASAWHQAHVLHRHSTRLFYLPSPYHASSWCCMDMLDIHLMDWSSPVSYPHSTLPFPSSLAIIPVLIHLYFFRLPHL